MLEFASPGAGVEVAADRTALDTILETQPDRPYSCRQGFCRTCRPPTPPSRYTSENPVWAMRAPGRLLPGGPNLFGVPEFVGDQGNPLHSAMTICQAASSLWNKW
ncbi:2Fe-2S iron-sulfur cluster binding domain-containing protein [Nocardia brasiliensis]|uniref:2Fe-2S iron-sulfur cluster binding domain-containing protein n=1 Tax=Nocardia brasiliensis TaxID=37326 RepID=UPI003D79D004